MGEWEVKHALRESERELRGKELAPRERIEELLAAVRRETAGLLPPGLAGGSVRSQVICMKQQ